MLAKANYLSFSRILKIHEDKYFYPTKQGKTYNLLVNRNII